MMESLDKSSNKNLLNENKVLLEQNVLFKKRYNILNEKNEKLNKQNNNLIKEVKIIKEKFSKFAEQMEDLNLTNVKLIYKNQALCKDSLNERQKQKIVESISKACSIDEVKVVYDTLIDSVGSFPVFNKFGINGPKSLSEAVNNKDALMINRNKQDGKQANPVFERMQKLARSSIRE